MAANQAYRLLKDNELVVYGDDFSMYESSGFEQSADIIEKLYLAEVSRIGVDNVALLTPTEKNRNRRQRAQ